MTKHRKNTGLMDPHELAELRRAVACLGCGAVRRTGAKSGSTVINHLPRCGVWVRELDERRAEAAEAQRTAEALRRETLRALADDTLVLVRHASA